MRWTAALALTARSLRVDARSLKISLLRTAAILILVIALGITVTSAGLFGAPGLRLLTWLLFTNFFLLTFVGLTTFPSIVVEEKELRTLDLLRLAGLNPVAILVAKSAGALTSTALLLGVQVPFAMLAVMMGGVSAHQVLSGFAVLSAYGLLLFAVAMVCSVLSPTATRAMRLTTILVVGGLITVPLLASLAPSGSLAQSIARQWYELSVWYGIEQVIKTGYSAPIWNDVVHVHMLVAASLCLLAWLMFERVVRREVTARPKWGFLDSILGEPYHGRPRAGNSAFAWKDFHFLAGGVRAVRGRWCLYGALWVIVTVGVWNSFSGSGGLEAATVGTQVMWGLMLVALVLESLFLASRVLQEEVRLGTLAGLLAAPLVVQDWIDAKFSGALRILKPAIWFLVLGSVLPLFLSRGDERQAAFLMGSWLATLYVVANVWLAAHLTAYLSLVMQRGAAATVVGIFTAGHFILGLGMGACISTCMVPLIPVLIILFVAPTTRWLRRKIRNQVIKVAAAT